MYRAFQCKARSEAANGQNLDIVIQPGCSRISEVMMRWYAIIRSCGWLLVSKLATKSGGGGKRLVGVRCDIISAGWVIAESIASNTGSGRIEL